MTGRLAILIALAACNPAKQAPPPEAAPPAAEQVSRAEEPALQLAPAEHRHGDPHDWNDIYAGGGGFEHAPNRTLVKAIDGVTPGSAIDLGMGQGRNAIFLAEHGWKVTGVDTSEEGVRQATEAATRRKLPVTGIVADLRTYDLGVERWDLAAYIYMGDRKLLEPIKRSLKRGGRVVIEFFHADSNDYFPHGVDGFKTGELEKIFAGYKILRSEVADDVADFGQRPARLMRFVAQKQ